MRRPRRDVPPYFAEMGRGTIPRRGNGGGVLARSQSPLHHAAHGSPPHELRSQGGTAMTAPFPTRRQEDWRYADLEALKPVWEQFADPVTLTVGAGESFEEVWLPFAEDVQLRRVQLALGAFEEGAPDLAIKPRFTAGSSSRSAWKKARISSFTPPTSALAFRRTRSSRRSSISESLGAHAKSSARC